MTKLMLMTPECKEIVGYERFNPNAKYIPGTIDEITINEISMLKIEELHNFLKACLSLLSIKGGIINIMGTNPRMILREFNNYNLSIKDLNNALYKEYIHGIYTLDYISEIMQQVGFNIIARYIPQQDKWLIIGKKEYVK